MTEDILIGIGNVLEDIKKELAYKNDLKAIELLQKERENIPNTGAIIQIGEYEDLVDVLQEVLSKQKGLKNQIRRSELLDYHCKKTRFGNGLE